MLYVDLNLCTHEAYYELGDQMYKGLRLLTNACWLVALGIKYDRFHAPTMLEGHYTAASAQYPWAFCQRYAACLKLVPRYLTLAHRD